MKWLVKAILFKVLSALPGHYALYSFIQKKLTRSIVPTRERVLQKLLIGLGYREALKRHLNTVAFKDVVHLDIGAGWKPIMPLLFYSIGVERQVLCDIRKNMSIDVVRNVIDIFRMTAKEFPAEINSVLLRMPPMVKPGEALNEYFTRLGIKYKAPYGHEDLVSETSPRLITCTEVLMHFDEKAVKWLFKEILSVLKIDGGIFMANTHLYDIYSDFDKSISRYNKWRYSDFFWNNIVNSKLMSFNRFTYLDYRRFLEEGGFEILEFKVAGPTQTDLDELRRIRVNEKFSSIPEAVLAARDLFFVVKAKE